MSNNLTIADILSKAADLIEPEGAWIQYDYAQDAQERPCAPNDPDAVSWCAYGAIEKIGGHDARFEVGRMGGFTLGAFNDAAGRSQSEVVSKLREAAEKARGMAG